MRFTNTTIFATSGASLFTVLSFLVFAETGCQTERESQPADTHEIADDTDPASTSGVGDEDLTSDAAGTEPGASDTPPLPDPGVLSDAEITAITQAINSGEIELGELAIRKAQSPEVKEFAQLVVEDHRALSQENVDIATQPGGPQGAPDADAGGGQAGEASPPAGQAEGSEVMGYLTTETQKTMERLRSLSGADFDQAYVDSQVRMHSQALTLVERHLLPGTTAAPLQSSLRTAQSKIESHLQKAESLRDQLTGEAPSA
jgi:putative membrane protein